MLLWKAEHEQGRAEQLSHCPPKNEEQLKGSLLLRIKGLDSLKVQAIELAISPVSFLA
jgi:hypothetical protein